MRRACQTMRAQIDAFLLLAREPDVRELADVQILPVLQQAVARHQIKDEQNDADSANEYSHQYYR